MEKQVDRLHLVYGYIICGILILAIITCWILSCTGRISRTAFDNVAFASSIASIVLALVSIVHSIYSSGGVANSVGVLKDAEESIRKQVENLKGIEADIIAKVEEGDRGITDQISTMQKQMDAMLQSNESAQKASAKKTTDKVPVNIKTNSPLGNICLYACLKSMETGKTWRIDMFNDAYTPYLWGYVLALNNIPSSGFSCKLSDKEISNCAFSDDWKSQISTEKIKSVLANAKAKEEVQGMLEKLDAHFQ